MNIFIQDRELNTSPAYLRPGYAFGGSCLPKDLRAILSLARAQNVDMPVLSQVLVSNENHIDRAFKAITQRPRCKVAFFGLAFKPGTDDLRESPLVALAERLIGRGYELAIVDAFVNTARLTGANREFVEREIPHLDRLMTSDARAALNGADIVVIGHSGREEIDAIRESATAQFILDLVGVKELSGLPGVIYEGICW